MKIAALFLRRLSVIGTYDGHVPMSASGTKRTNNFSLPVSANITIAAKRSKHVLMAKILRPRLVLLRRLTELSSE